MTSESVTFTNRIRPRPSAPFSQWIFIAWLVAMISIPIFRWTLGDASARWGVPITVMLLTLCSVSILFQSWGIRMALRAIGLVVCLAWLLEYIGSMSGIPFGFYDYTNILRPQLFGVPLVIPFAWLMMFPSAWAIAYRITHRLNHWTFILTSALAFTAWDLFLDPQMVMWGFWKWQSPGSYFGIPLVNFLGWALGTALITMIVRPAPLTDRLLILIYVATWLLQSLGLFLFWAMPGPALAGFLGMGLFIFLAWHSSAPQPTDHV